MTGLGRTRGKRQRAPCSEMHSQWPLEKHLDASDMDYVFAGDLLGQSMATTFGVENFRIPWFGVYGACSTCGESPACRGICGSRVCKACGGSDIESLRQCRKAVSLPNQYANQRPVSATWTVTGSAAFIVGSGAGGNEIQAGCDNADSISKRCRLRGSRQEL